MDRFSAFRIHEREGRIEARIEHLVLDDLSPGEVVIRVTHSGINYKDALAATGAGRILRRYPLVGGIDLAGYVEFSADAAFQPGDAVLATGCGLSETRDGGFAEYARVPAEAVVAMPAGLDAAAAMSIGTAGFAAALAIMRMEANGQTPAAGPIAVTGATGGVGSLAIDMLAANGYEVAAISGKADASDYLRALGAGQILLRQEIDYGNVPLAAARWGGAIDNVGARLLSWLLRSTRERGNVASVGLAGGTELNVSVMPFILRGVSLLGVNSAATPRALRLQVWQRIATDLKPRHLAAIVRRTITLAELPGAFAEYLDGRVLGRTLVRMR
ncbi:MAG: acryloyl-CoA reductase [Steroidobacterales bacterium]